MIDKVLAVSFKGLEFSFDLKRLNLVVGPMGCGKTSISDTIELTATGRIEGAGKTNQAIMDAFATDSKMYVGVGSNDQFFERRFIRNKAGKVTQKFRAGTVLVTKEDFTTAFAVAGRPTIFNLKAFMDLSDEKKINKVFELYPPEGDVFVLNERITESADEINLLNAEITKAGGVVQKLTVDQAAFELPAGTLAEVQQAIERTTAEVMLTRKNFIAQLKKETEAEAKEKAEKEAEAKAAEKEEHRPQLGGPVTHTARNSEDFQRPIPDPTKEAGVTDYTTTSGSPEHEEAPLRVEITDRDDAIALVQSIIDTMDKAGCSTCAAKIVAKQALKKL